jgi:hypothetical protein
MLRVVGEEEDDQDLQIGDIRKENNVDTNR